MTEFGYDHTTRSHNTMNHQQLGKVNQMSLEQSESLAMVFRHPPTSPNYPILYKDQTFWENTSKMAHRAANKR